MLVRAAGSLLFAVLSLPPLYVSVVEGGGLLEAAKNEEWDLCLNYLAVNPEEAREKDDITDKIALHYVAAHPDAPLVLVQKLLEAYPDGARVKDKATVARVPGYYTGTSRPNKLPLFYAVENGAAVAVVQALLDAYPDGVKEKDVVCCDIYQDGYGYEYKLTPYPNMLPLHAAAKNASEAVVLMLLKSYPDGAKQYDAIPVQFPPIPSGYNAGQQYRLSGAQIFNETTSTWTGGSVPAQNKLPLHYSVENRALSVEVIRALLEAYPDGAKEKDYLSVGDNRYDNTKYKYVPNRLPLHAAVEHADASAEVVRALLEFYPEGARIKNSIYNNVCVSDTSSSYSSPCWSAYVDAGQKESNKIPLFVAVEHHASTEVVQALLKAYPEGAKEKDWKFVSVGTTISRQEVFELRPDRLPLHASVGNRASLGVVQALLEAYPEGAEQALPNMQLSLPLHLAAKQRASLEVVQALLQAYPAAAWKRANFYAAVDLAETAEVREAISAADPLNRLKSCQPGGAYQVEPPSASPPPGELLGSNATREAAGQAPTSPDLSAKHNEVQATSIRVLWIGVVICAVSVAALGIVIVAWRKGLQTHFPFTSLKRGLESSDNGDEQELMQQTQSDNGDEQELMRQTQGEA